MLNKELIKKLDMTDSAVWLATWGGCGLMKKAPGTWGSLGGVPLGLLLMMIGGWPWLLMGSIIVFIVGYRAAKKFEDMSGEHDCGAIVIDEVAGICVTMLMAPPTFAGIALSFLLFRFFDILKPWPVSWFDKRPGAFGVMADDIMAGIYAALCLGGLQYAGLI